ncbi:MAG: heme b synthase [Candidatus Alcyoniella australis]|nr:heme b synthase [Candidatus Alcyoniella australis]
MKEHDAFIPRLIAWEVTRSCVLECMHCRAAACKGPYAGELDTDQIKAVMDDIASFAKPIIILTGGEPMLRDDILEITRYGASLGLRMVMAPCGMLLTEKKAKEFKDAGIQRISISLDGPDAKSHDAFRGVVGAFDGAMTAIENAKKVGLEFQINTTVSKVNLDRLPEILDLSVSLGAVAFHPFLLVPTGRGKQMADLAITPEQYEETLVWIYERRGDLPLNFKPTCAPHYYRIFRQKERAAGRSVTVETHGMDAMSKGCMGGLSFAFISHVGKVQMCGFAEEEAGDLLQSGLSFKKIWRESEFFLKLRDWENYKGKCGYCEFRKVCGGCRARAFAATGDYFAEEPYCVYEPKKRREGR